MITENRDVPKLETKGKIYKHMEKKVKCGIRKYFYLIMKLPTRSIRGFRRKSHQSVSHTRWDFLNSTKLETKSHGSKINCLDHRNYEQPE